MGCFNPQMSFNIIYYALENVNQLVTVLARYITFTSSNLLLLILIYNYYSILHAKIKNGKSHSNVGTMDVICYCVYSCYTNYSKTSK